MPEDPSDLMKETNSQIQKAQHTQRRKNRVFTSHIVLKPQKPEKKKKKKKRSIIGSRVWEAMEGGFEMWTET